MSSENINRALGRDEPFSQSSFRNYRLTYSRDRVPRSRMSHESAIEDRLMQTKATQMLREEDARQSLLLRALRRLVWKIGRILTRMVYRIRVEGVENIPQQGGGLLVSNHLSMVDAF